MLKVAIIGLGDVSAIHYLGIQYSQTGQLVAVCDKNDALKNKYPNIPFYTDIETMLQTESLDVVHVCLPHYLHYTVTKLCLSYGVHVLQEKPLALSYKEGLALKDIVDNRSPKVAICFQNRNNPTFIQLMEELAKRETGDILAVKALVAWHRGSDYYQTKPWRAQWETAGGGTIINQAVHTLDLMQLIGGSLQSCLASLSNIGEAQIEVEDTAVATFGFNNECQGFYMSTNAYAFNSSVQIEVVTEAAIFILINNALIKHVEGEAPIILARDVPMEGSKSYYGASHGTLIRAFYEAIIHDTDDYIHVEDALPSMLMIDAMKQSSLENRQIKMEEIIHG
ncbi:Gfo/Idh/MocA family protein [Fundicoccus culcitae]|uniref:Gfo/Idh/MocA family oxidoreductase n=1 Tax=Fundicoccus culcitae TaxID=2969821 RepID=A0ABY5P7I8_9LACT|nr:Gfo/Idh/MocA family oxidoreductase [Fundicoccus culcitae]UUX34413.1 Gfo/Idh/MocA family oxidoreductase [Fundicoccus culcitae]